MRSVASRPHHVLLLRLHVLSVLFGLIEVFVRKGAGAVLRRVCDCVRVASLLGGIADDVCRSLLALSTVVLFGAWGLVVNAVCKVCDALRWFLSFLLFYNFHPDAWGAHTRQACVPIDGGIDALACVAEAQDSDCCDGKQLALPGTRDPRLHEHALDDLQFTPLDCLVDELINTYAVECAIRSVSIDGSEACDRQEPGGGGDVPLESLPATASPCLAAVAQEHEIPHTQGELDGYFQDSLHSDDGRDIHGAIHTLASAACRAAGGRASESVVLQIARRCGYRDSESQWAEDFGVIMDEYGEYDRHNGLGFEALMSLLLDWSCPMSDDDFSDEWMTCVLNRDIISDLLAELADGSGNGSNA